MVIFEFIVFFEACECRSLLDMESYFFQLTMVHNAEMLEKNELKPVTRMWRKVAASLILGHKILEYISMLAIEIAMFNVDFRLNGRWRNI